MTIQITLTGTRPGDVQPEAADLLRAVGGAEPAAHMPTPDAVRRRNLGVTLAVVSIVLAVPGFVLAVDEANRRYKLMEKVKALKKRLAASDAGAMLAIEGETPVDLKRTATDAIVDLLLKDRGG